MNRSVLWVCALVAMAIAAVALCASHAQAAPWKYDFLGETGDAVNPGFDPTFLPRAPAGSLLIRVGDNGGGFHLDNPGESDLGRESELRISAPAGASVNKFGVYRHKSERTFYIRFEVKFTGGHTAANAAWYFFQGRGAMYSNAEPFAPAQVFTGIRWNVGSGSDLTMNYRNATDWSAGTAGFSSAISKNEVHTLEVYGNNATSFASYIREGIDYTVAANTWDLWVDDNRFAGLDKAQLPGSDPIDSFVFYGEAAAESDAQLHLDELVYWNELPGDNATPTLTKTPEPTPTAIEKPTTSPTRTPTAPPTPSPSATAPASPSPSPSRTEAPTPSRSPEPTPSLTPEPTASRTPEPTPSVAPTATPKPTPEPTPEPSPTKEPTPLPSPTPAPSATPEPTASPEPTAPPTPAPTTAPPTPAPTTAPPTPAPTTPADSEDKLPPGKPVGGGGRKK